MKKICLTFDYELFFGKTGTIENCLIKPTYEILKVLNENNLKGTFFIDASFLGRLRDIKQEAFNYKRIVEQLICIVDSGHRIELHLHPHWLDAEYSDGQWIFPHYQHYRLQTLPESMITDLFVSGTNLLEEIARKSDNNYKVIAFRAGGWCIQPFEKLKNGFLQAGIKIDSSVATGQKDWGGAQVFDFVNAPNSSFWRFSNDPCKIDDSGQFLELPISVYKRTFFDRLQKYLYLTVSNDKHWGDGAGMNSNNCIHFNVFNKFESFQTLLSTDSVGKHEFLGLICDSKNDVFVFINHPKVMFKKRGLLNLRECGRFNTIYPSDLLG